MASHVLANNKQDTVEKRIEEAIGAEGISEVEYFVDEIGNPQRIVKLDEKGMENFNKLMNDPSLHYLKEFIRITKAHRENVSDKFYNLVLELENTINTYNAPWYVPYYQAVRNAILCLIFVNSNPNLLSEDDYKKAIDAIGNIIEELITNFKPDESGEYNTFPIKYSVKAIFDIAQEKLSDDAPNLFEKYEENLKKIEDRKSKIRFDTIRMFIVLHEFQTKHKKYERLYNILLTKAYPNKYSIKRPKPNLSSEELLQAAGQLVIEKQYKVEDLFKDYGKEIGDDIVKALEIKEEDLERVHNEILVERLTEEIPELKQLMEQVRAANEDLSKLKNIELFNMITEAVEEIDSPEGEAETDQAAEDLFNKINEKLPDEYKGRKKTKEELEAEKGE